ncbi:MAG TPA: RluA family pseudouridine synthase [Clostridia bacterium]
MEKQIIIAEKDNDRLDVFLTEVLDITRSQIKKLIDSGNILVGGQKVKSGKSLRAGDVIEITIPDEPETQLIPENIPIDIVYEDEDLAVINKPQGIVVHPGAGVYSGTLANALMYHFSSLSSDPVRPGIVHRLDKDTSGLLVVAKNDYAHLNLAQQIAQKTAVRIYRALLQGIVKEDSGVIEKNIVRDPKDRKKFAAVNDAAKGRYAITYYKVLERFEKYTYAEFKLGTGRTHQIRVHAKYLGHPVVGDMVYGHKNQDFKDLKGQLLHAYMLEFDHPTKNVRMSFCSQLPDYFEAILQKLRAINLQKQQKMIY